ncbi:MAG: hypothetical protein QM535_11010 [Limnohabitans sp.]|nr:hypothetical protein [Limnohabitans sp.]
MDIQAELKWIHQEIDKVSDPTFLEKLKHLLQNFGKTEDDTDYNIDIDNALKNIEKGNYYSTQEARELSKKWERK